MFENLGGMEFVALLLVALLIFGDRLPTVIGDGLRMLRRLRAMAQNATNDLSRELGTDIQLEDLNPKTFIRKHLLSEEEEAALRKPLQGVYNDLRADITGVRKELEDVASAVDPRSSNRSPSTRAGTSGGGAATRGADASAGTRPTEIFDTDAT